MLFGILVLSNFTLLFLVLSAVYRSWLIYRDHSSSLKVTDYFTGSDANATFLLEGDIHCDQGTCAQFQRFYEGEDVAIAFAEIGKMNSQGQYPAKILWSAPGHFRDLKMGRLLLSDIEVKLFASWETVQRLITERIME